MCIQSLYIFVCMATIRGRLSQWEDTVYASTRCLSFESTFSTTFFRTRGLFLTMDRRTHSKYATWHGWRFPPFSGSRLPCAITHIYFSEKPSRSKAPFLPMEYGVWCCHIHMPFMLSCYHSYAVSAINRILRNGGQNPTPGPKWARFIFLTFYFGQKIKNY